MARFLPANQPCRWDEIRSVVSWPDYIPGELSQFPIVRLLCLNPRQWLRTTGLKGVHASETMEEGQWLSGPKTERLERLPWPCGPYRWIEVFFHLIVSVTLLLFPLMLPGRCWRVGDILICIVSISFCVPLKEDVWGRETARQLLLLGWNPRDEKFLCCWIWMSGILGMSHTSNHLEGPQSTSSVRKGRSTIPLIQKSERSDFSVNLKSTRDFRGEFHPFLLQDPASLGRPLKHLIQGRTWLWALFSQNPSVSPSGRAIPSQMAWCSTPRGCH